MESVKWNPTWKQGKTVNYELLLKDVDGDLIDFTGFIVKLRAKEQLDDTTLTLDLSTTNGYIILKTPNTDMWQSTDSTLGNYIKSADFTKKIIQILVPATITEDWEFDKVIYELTCEDDSGYVFQPIEGKITIKRMI